MKKLIIVVLVAMFVVSCGHLGGHGGGHGGGHSNTH